MRSSKWCSVVLKKGVLLQTFQKKIQLFCQQFNIGKKVKEFCEIVKMKDSEILDPPKTVHGMKVLDKECFKKEITVPSLEVKNIYTSQSHKILKNYYLKVQNKKALTEVESSKIQLLLNPCLINSWDDFNDDVKSRLSKIGITKDDLKKINLNLTYENWFAETLLKAILPKDEPPLTSFSIIGHIIHLNIKEHLLEYKHIIAQILLDKNPNIKTVVYKKKNIDNVYRNFEMEVLCGEPNFVVSVKENGSIFEFDFSKVYWNPRLGTEHDRIKNLIKEGDVLFDVFAGVGPFAIPAAKKKCMVFANDLNPDSYKWLNHNVSLNKKCKDYITTFNKDGSDFILQDVKSNLLKIWEKNDFSGKIHVVMNLPALAPTFLKYFKGLIDKNNLNLERVKKHLPIIYCHFFAPKAEDKKKFFELSSGIVLDDIEHTFIDVRCVSSSKIMYRITFQLPLNYLLVENADKDEENGEPLPKKFCSV